MTRLKKTLLLLLFPALTLAAAPPPAHLLKGVPRPWVKAARALVEHPEQHHPSQTAEVAPKGSRPALLIFEFVGLKLGDRKFETVLLARAKADPGDWMLELTPGKYGPPIAPEEVGDVLLVGEGANYWIFRIKAGPFAGDLLVWSTASGHRGVGGEAVRIYSKKAASHEPTLKAYLP